LGYASLTTSKPNVSGADGKQQNNDDESTDDNYVIGAGEDIFNRTDEIEEQEQAVPDNPLQIIP
jgi:hypothetical protein